MCAVIPTVRVEFLTLRPLILPYQKEWKGGGADKNYQGVPKPEYISNILVLIGNNIPCGLYKVALLAQSQITLHVTVFPI